MNKTLKRALYIVGGLIILGFVGLQVALFYTKSHSPQETVTLTNDEVELTVTYSRPYKKGRVIFGDLVPYDRVWRTGANEATVFTTSRDLKINGSTLPAGEYSLWTIPGRGKWQVIFNTEVGQWGVTGTDLNDNRDPANDVLTTEAEVFPTGQVVEQFTIDLEDAEGIELVLSWEEVLVMVPIDL